MLRWTQLANDWRKHLCALRVRQVELDARTLKRERDAIAACKLDRSHRIDSDYHA
ncbi:hypothetical protein [Caballeronia grimmiae]|uniref:hypothetical protein n=1 Tax=Caballeronia grimmiae TaxID=1071679 RepID=UPI0038BB5CC2